MTAKREKILILGGTREAAELAAKLVNEGHHVTTSLAGRTREPEPIAGKLRIGGFSEDNKSGAQGLADYIKANGFDRLIDATHPFAENISKNASEAAYRCGIAFESRQRAPWQKHADDIWIEVVDLDAAVHAIPEGSIVLLALGSQHIHRFATRGDVHFIVRMVDPPPDKLPFEKSTLLLGKPSVEWRREADLLRAHHISHIVCRNSGGQGAYAKIEAARRLRLPVIIVKAK